MQPYEKHEIPHGASSNIHHCHSHPYMSPTLTSQHTDTSSTG